MTGGGRIVVTAGPTISPDDVRVVMPNTEVVLPISVGDAFGYWLRRAILCSSSADFSISTGRCATKNC